jgi:hypothetical protein
MLCTLAEAVAATGSSKSSILGAIEAGRITATKDLFGEWRIERGELHRLYPPAGKDTGNAPHEYPAHDAGMLEVEIEALISAAGDGLRQPGDDQRRGNPGLGAGQAAPKAAHHLFADPDRGDLWSRHRGSRNFRSQPASRRWARSLRQMTSLCRSTSS